MAEPRFFGNEQGELDAALRIASAISIAPTSFKKIPECAPSVNSPLDEREYTQQKLEQRFDRSHPLHLDSLGLNSKELTIADV